MRVLTALWSPVLGLLLTACGGGGTDPAPAPTPPQPSLPQASAEREVPPLSTDAAMRTALEPHRVRAPGSGVSARGRLFVFLPGTGATPAVYRQILRVGSERGYHAIGLNYPNAQAIGVLCADSADPDCHGKARQETLTGQDLSALLAVAPADALLNRLVKLLQHLQTQAPAEGWGGFLRADGQPDWGRITIAGHSQGGGHAALLAQQFGVQRAVYFASPADWDSRLGRPAAWALRGALTTPAVRQWGFTHEDDPLVSLATATRLWAAQGLPGTPTRVDGQASPWGGSQQLTTRLSPGTAGGASASPAHGAPVVDAVTPLLADGSPAYAPVWIALCFGD